MSKIKVSYADSNADLVSKFNDHKLDLLHVFVNKARQQQFKVRYLNLFNTKALTLGTIFNILVIGN